MAIFRLKLVHYDKDFKKALFSVTESTNSISDSNEDYQQLPTSRLGIFRKAAVVSDAHGCASHGK